MAPWSRAGNRIYVLEELWMAESLEPSPLNLISQRANFYQVQAPPPH